MPTLQNRRRFLAGMTSAGVMSLSANRGVFAEDAPLETATVRFAKATGICIAPQFVAEAMLRAEGFTDYQSVRSDAGLAQTEMLATGEVDFGIDFATAYVIPIDRGAPIKVLSGVHVGCYELFARDGINSIVDLKGRNVGVGANLVSDPHIFVSVMAAFVGLDPAKDINWITGQAKPADLFADGKVDAFLAFPPEAQDLRARKVGHVILNSALDRPWSQYFCCMLAANAAYAEKHPVASKRVIRAVLKAADLCVSEPQTVARLLIDGKYADQYEYAVQSLMEIPYRNWRDYDPEDTIRFFSLRLHEAGLITGSPQQIIANGTDWRLFNELKRELKT